MTTQTVNLNMTPGGVPSVLYVSQYDVGRSLSVIVYDGTATLDVSAYTCTIEGTRGDGTAFVVTGTAATSTVTFATTATMTNTCGRFPCELVLTDSDSNRVGSANFLLVVEPAAMDENSEAVEEDASLFQQYTESMNGAVAELQGSVANLTTNGMTEVQAGSVSVSAESSSTSQPVSTAFSVTFSEEFTSTPYVVANVQHSSNVDMTVKITARSTTGFSGIVVNWGSSGSAATVAVNWIAAVGLTTLNSELTDIRTGAAVLGSTAYDTAGNAVRGQVAALYNLIGDNTDLIKALAIKKSITSLPIVISDGGDGLPMVSARASMAYSADGYTGCNLYVTGKNLLTNVGTTATQNDVTFTVNADGSVSTSGTASANTTFYVANRTGLWANLSAFVGREVVCSGCPSGGSSSTYRMFFARLDGAALLPETGSGLTLTVGDFSEGNAYVRIEVFSGTNMDGLTFYPMIRLATNTDDTFEAYDGTTYTIDWTDSVGTIYGGGFEFVSGTLTSLYDSDGTQIATETYYLDGQDVVTLLGDNVIWSDTDNLTVKYCADTALYIASL